MIIDVQKLVFCAVIMLCFARSGAVKNVGNEKFIVEDDVA